MSPSRRTRWTLAAAMCALAAVVAACSVNPQPLPPGGDDDTPLPGEVGRGNDNEDMGSGTGAEAAPPQAPGDAGSVDDDGGDGGDDGSADAGDGG